LAVSPYFAIRSKGIVFLISRDFRMPRPQLTEELILHWLRCFREKCGHWPSLGDIIVWDKKDGEWVKIEGEDWTGLNRALHRGSRGLETLRGMTLATLKAKHKLTPEAEFGQTGHKPSPPRYRRFPLRATPAF
jgi:hypothetical protein